MWKYQNRKDQNIDTMFFLEIQQIYIQFFLMQSFRTKTIYFDLFYYNKTYKFRTHWVERIDCQIYNSLIFSASNFCKIGFR